MRTPMDDVTPAAVRDGLARVRESIAAAARRSGRSAADVTIVAAVKYVDAEACAHLVAAGVRDLGESRLEQLVARQQSDAVPADARWHYIGRLQSRQAGQIADRCACIHTLASMRAASRLAATGARPRLLVQVNIDRDPAKDGLAPGDVEEFLLSLPEQVEVSGFMAMPAATEEPERSRPAFSALRELRDEVAVRVAGRHQLHALSIGTSQDFAVAVEEGATHVRLGRILYGGAE